MDLQAFFPYRLAVLSEAVSLSLAEVYADRFKLSRDAWRVLAALAALPLSLAKSMQLVPDRTEPPVEEPVA